MANRWKTMETMTDFIFLASKITTTKKLKDLFLESKSMTNLDSALKSGYITLLTKVYIVEVRVFLVVIYECESWTIKKAEH